MIVPLIEETGSLHKIEELQQHENEVISEKSHNIIDRYFSEEQEEEE